MKVHRRSLMLALMVLMAMIQIPARGEALQSGAYRYALTDDGKAVIERYAGTEPNPVIPQTLDGHDVIGIGDDAFRDLGSLTDVSLPAGVESIGAQAFYNCAGLRSANFPDTLRVIGELAFSYCNSLEEITIPEGTETIGECAFGDCPRLRWAAIPASVTRIDTDAFYGAAEGFEIRGVAGSTAQTYALAAGIPFRDIGDVTPTARSAQSPFESPLQAEQSVTAQIVVHYPHGDRTGSYTGAMKDGIPNGQGSFTAVLPSGLRYTYSGAWENGAMNGQGEVTWSDGIGMRGFWRGNQAYEGDWLIDGAVIYSGGFQFCVECGESVFHGPGKWYDRSGRLIWEGLFDSGYPVTTAEQRAAHARQLDEVCVPMSPEEAEATMNAPSGKLLKLEGRVSEILADEEHGYGALIVLNRFNGNKPVNVCYRYGIDEERPQVGSRVTVYGAAAGAFRSLLADGKERIAPRVDAHAVVLTEGKPAAAPARVVFTAMKELTGRPLKNREFSFVLNEMLTVITAVVNPFDGTVRYVPVTTAKQLQTKRNDRDGTVAFDPIRFTKKDIGGVFTYTITEISSPEAGMVCDPMEMVITVLVVEEGALVFYPDDLIFNNSIQPATVEANIAFMAALEGRTLRNGEFAFELLDNGGRLLTKKNGRDGRVAFEPILYTRADVGRTAAYIVRQVPGTEAGMRYDLSPKRVNVTIMDIGNGSLRAEVTYPDGTVFENSFGESPPPALTPLPATAFPTAEQLNGTWTSFTVTFTEMNFSDESEEGCAEMVKALLNVPIPGNLTIRLDARGQGSMQVEGDIEFEAKAQYSQGQWTAAATEEGATISFTGTASLVNGIVSMDGALSMSGEGLFMAGTWSAQK